jgi:hypothetical protein
LHPDPLDPTDTDYHPALDARPTPVPLRVSDDFYDTPLRVTVESLIDCPNDDSHTMVAGSICHCGARDYSTTS